MTRRSRLRFIISGGLISCLGVFLATIIIYDMYTDVVFENNRLFTTILENSFPLVFNASIVGTGYWLTQNENEEITRQTLLWTGISVTGILLLAVWVYGIQIVQGQLKPFVILAQITSMGALAGIIVGIYSGRQSQRQRELESLFHNSSDCIAEIHFKNDEPIIDRVNGEFERTFGYSSSVIRGASIDELIVDSSHGQHAANLSDGIRRGDQFETEVERVTAHGTTRTFQLQIIPIADDGPSTRGYAVYSDITESKRYTERVNALHWATRELITAETTEEVAERGVEAVDTILGLDISTIFFERNGRLEPVASTKSAQELLEEIGPLKAGESAAWQVFESEQAVQTANVQELDTIQNPDTQIKSEMILPLSGYGVLLIGDTTTGGFNDDQFTLSQILGSNIETALERVEREQELISRKRQLVKQNERLETFTSIVSHDLRNPLSVANGYVELARQKTSGIEELDQASEALDRMDSLIDELLTLAKQGDTIDERSSFTLDAVAGTAWETTKTTNATLQVEDEIQFSADENRIRQLLENLFRNAMEHGGADVTVTVGSLDDGFFVADTGPGIPDDERDEIFEHGYTTSEEGTGFGLAIVQQIVTAHGGRIDVGTSQTGGARFEIHGIGSDDSS